MTSHFSEIEQKWMRALTWSSFMATHELEGNPWSIGTKNCRQPLQWPISSIIQIKLNMRINTDAMLRNYERKRELEEIDFLLKFIRMFSKYMHHVIYENHKSAYKWRKL